MSVENKEAESSADTLNPSNVQRKYKGWLHPSKQILEEGICYRVRYIGSLDINTSMKSLDFETRSQLAKECLNRVCEAAGLKSVDKRRRPSKKIIRMLAPKPNLINAGANVNLTITSATLKISFMESEEIIANHDMPNVSFASGGDADTLDFIAYVAKDGVHGRSCYVLECGGGLAQDIMITIGQAFHLRYNESLGRNTDASERTMKLLEDVDNKWPKNAKQDDPEYYNDLPGKMPPETFSSSAFSLPEYQNNPYMLSASGATALGNFCGLGSTGNLIDLSSEPSSPLTKMAESVHGYVNDCIGISESPASWPSGTVDGTGHKKVSSKDPFDMQPFEDALPLENPPLPPSFQAAAGSLAPKQKLSEESWFHGYITRQDAEALLLHDGDFLVRESQASGGQFVLSGMHNGTKKHLLLIDPEGMVRTKDTVFDSISHLVHYHRTRRLPILSADSALLLRSPITRVAQ